MIQLIKINNIVFNLAQIISVEFGNKQLYGKFNEGCEFIPLAQITTTQIDCGADGNYSVTHEFLGKDAVAVEKLFGGYALAEIGQNVVSNDFYSEETARLSAEVE